MSKATKRKHVTNEVVNDFFLPEGEESIVKVIGGRGNNLHEIETPKGETFLVSMPTKFRKNVWIKRGDYVIIIPIEEGDKVRAEIAHILYKEQIKYIEKEGLWPEEYKSAVVENKNAMIPDDMMPPSDDDSEYDTESGSDEEKDNIPSTVNPNRQNVRFCEIDSSDNEDKDSETNSSIPSS